MMNSKHLFWMGLLLSLVAVGRGEDVLLFDFEEDALGWRADWGCNQGEPVRSRMQSHHGMSSMEVSHEFKKENESAAVVGTLDVPKNVTGFKIQAWLFLPKRVGDWQAQLYVRSGEEANPVFGKLTQDLKDGWNLLEMDVGEIPEPADVREVGVQIKNWGSAKTVSFYIDEVGLAPSK